MSRYKATIHWKKQTPFFDYEVYNREHEWQFQGGTVINASAAPEFRGEPDCVDPEQAFVAAIAACHMLTFLALCSRKQLTVEEYSDSAVGFMEKNPDGGLWISRVILHPHIRFLNGLPDRNELQALHDQAHKQCFIANSIKTDVRVNCK